MIEVLISVLALVAAVSVAYLLTIIDFIVHHQLYRFGLQFSYDWANPYWTVLRISLGLLGFIAVLSSFNIAHFIWKRLRKPKAVKRAEKAELVEPVEVEETGLVSPSVPTLYQCTSCGRSITHPLRMLDFHSQRPRMVNICPFCNATVVPASYTYKEEEEEERAKKHSRKDVKAL